MRYTYEIRTKTGTLRLSSDNDLEVHRVATDESASSTTEAEIEQDGQAIGYKRTVMECHRVLDELGIPSAKGIECNDPGCESALGHRVRELRKIFLSRGDMLDKIKSANDLTDVRKLLESYNH